ncbi:type II secretion protein [Spartobacteria bacterium LR76]|nr:type II secretion protein [Spartobacteria bacterium LR76]
MISVVALVGILITLAIPAWSRARHAYERAATISSLRAIGSAMQLYAADNDGYLPGPFWSGNFASYSTLDDRTLGYRLWSYLGIPAPTGALQTAKILTNPANTRLRQSPQSPVYFLTDRITADGLPNIDSPWGKRDSSTTPATDTRPVKLAVLSNYSLSKTWAIQDIDQQLMPSNYSRYGQLPRQPVLGDVRMTLYFDWHVAPVPVN